MMKFASLAAAVAVSALFAGSASAADLRVVSPTVKVVHIALAGKSLDQVKGEIKTAAVTVCGATDAVCINDAVDDAFSQLSAIERARQPVAKLDVEPGGAAVVRVSLKGKSAEAIEADLKEAAQTVCKATNTSMNDYDSCVVSALRDAHAQLAKAEGSTRLASN